MNFDDKQIIFFDGVCNLCTGMVQFVLRRDKRKQLLFASLQSPSGQAMLQHFGLPQNNFNSFIFVKNGKLFQKSSGALHICRLLSGAWPIGYGFIIVPRFIRDWVYDRVAQNRYRWFGQQKECWLPTPELQARFLP
jgi:predicted DCC family thiol-disulfide oxidoreductase YuxK